MCGLTTSQENHLVQQQNHGKDVEPASNTPPSRLLDQLRHPSSKDTSFLAKENQPQRI